MDFEVCLFVSLGGLFSHYRPRDILWRIDVLSIVKFFMYIYERQFDFFQRRILKRVSPHVWDEMMQQIAPVKKDGCIVKNGFQQQQQPQQKTLLVR